LIGFLIRRISQAAVVVPLVTVITFILLRAIPGNGDPEPGRATAAARSPACNGSLGPYPQGAAAALARLLLLSPRGSASAGVRTEEHV